MSDIYSNNVAIEYYVTVEGNKSSSVYPNPVSDILNIDLDAGENTTSSKTINYNIRLYDWYDNLMRITTGISGIVQFNVANLPNDNYFLHIYDGVNSKPEITQIVVKH